MFVGIVMIVIGTFLIWFNVLIDHGTSSLVESLTFLMPRFSMGAVKFAGSTLVWAFFAYVTVMGMLNIKNSGGVIGMKFTETEMTYATVNIRSKGDVLASGFGYFQEYHTIRYEDIADVAADWSFWKIEMRVKTRDGITRVIPVGFPKKDKDEVVRFLKAQIKPSRAAKETDGRCAHLKSGKRRAAS
ncbi:MAG: hypothetical protein LBT23_09185 [Synergistaceae bacterium]|nr:hypothetical protein [Synergistaceae bacterium]